MLIIPSNQENEKQNIAFNIEINIFPDRKVNITNHWKQMLTEVQGKWNSHSLLLLQTGVVYTKISMDNS